MQSEERLLDKLTARYLRLAIISLYVMALLQGLHPFFLTLFFWISVGFGALALNYFIASKRAAQPEQMWRKQNESTSAASSENKRSPILVIIIIGMSVMIFVTVIRSKMSSGEANENTKAETEKAADANQQSEKTHSAYDLAAQEYNNKNYRQSISMSRQALFRQ